MTLDVDLKCSFFYVDDDPDDIELFKEAATSLGEKCCVFELGELMLHSLHNPPPEPSIVFVDLNMPSMDGFEVIRRIKNAPSLQQLPIVVYSTSGSLKDVIKCRELGASIFATKQVTISGIRNMLENILKIDWHNRVVTSDNFIYKSWK